MTSLVIALIGPDRPGLVELLAETITEHGGNWLESHLGHLSGQFAGVVRLEVPADRVASLQQALQALESRNLKVLWEVEEQMAEPVDYVPVTLDLVGTDRPGIVREISQALATRQVNVEDFQSTSSGAPMSGERIFRVQARLRLPPQCTLDGLRAELEQIAHDLMVDITLDMP